MQMKDLPAHLAARPSSSAAAAAAAAAHKVEDERAIINGNREMILRWPARQAKQPAQLCGANTLLPVFSLKPLIGRLQSGERCSLLCMAKLGGPTCSPTGSKANSLANLLPRKLSLSKARAQTRGEKGHPIRQTIIFQYFLIHLIAV